MKVFILKNLKNILLLCCFVMAAANVFIAIVFNDALHTGNAITNEGANINFIVSLNEDYNKSDDIIKAQMLSSTAIGADEKEDIIKKLIKEYLTDRYTVVMHRDLSAQKFFPIDADMKDRQKIIIKPQLSKVMSMGHGRYETMPATKDYINNDAAEYNRLMRENTTRSVEIISEPRRDAAVKNRWNTRMKLVYKTPNIDYIADAKTEIYDVSMAIDTNDDNGIFINEGAAAYVINRNAYPANVFNFTVIRLDKKLSNNN